MNGNLVEFVLNNPGLFVGLGVVVVATALLPRQVRYYVLTAGVAVVIFRLLQLAWARSRVKELDKEREKLLEEWKELRARGAMLEEKHKQLVTQQEEVLRVRDELIRQRKELDDMTAASAVEKERLDAALAEKQQEHEALRDEAAAVAGYLEGFASAERMVASVPTHI